MAGLPDDVDGYRLTWRRWLNFHRNRFELRRGRTFLRSRPSRLVIEPTNVCNLHCPYCHTGAGRFGRRPAMLKLDRVRHLLDEIGDYLLLVEVFNWGEAMLHPQLPEIIAEASKRGISTRVNTNFSLPFSAREAECLVGSGLTDLFVAVDGASQEAVRALSGWRRPDPGDRELPNAVGSEAESRIGSAADDVAISRVPIQPR